jgi:signal transduction histidine kinase
MEKQTYKGKKNKLLFLFFILLFFISIAFTAYFAWESHVRFKETLVKQWNQQLESTLEISSINLTNYFTKFSQNLNYLSHNVTVQEWAYKGEMTNCTGTYCPLGNLYKLHQNEIDALVLLDSTGNVVERFSKSGKGNKIHEKCASNPSLNKSTFGRDVQISEVFKNKEDQFAITISYPLYYNKRFAGAVRWMIETEHISRQFIAPVKVGEKGYMFVFDNNEKIISHPNKMLIGRSVQSIVDSVSEINKSDRDNEHLDETLSFFDNIKNSGTEGYGRYIDFAYNQYCIAAYKKIEIGNKRWVLVVSMPYSEISNPVLRNARTTFGLAAAILLIILIIGIAFFLMQKKKAKLEVETKYLTELAKTAEELRIERSMRLTAMIDGQENERQRISREIHDGLGQYLLAMKVKLENAIISRNVENDKSLEELKSLFIRTIEEVKRISDNLIPVILDEFGISTALKNLCDDIAGDNNIKIEFVSFGVPANIDYKIQTYLYRIAQEGLSNIIKHSKASEANVQLLGNADQVNLVIEDDGSGFDVKGKTKGNGLNNMKERAAILNGTVEIISKPGEGTTIAIKIPLK